MEEGENLKFIEIVDVLILQFVLSNYVAVLFELQAASSTVTHLLFVKEKKELTAKKCSKFSDLYSE